MTKAAGTSSTFKIDVTDGGALVDISAYVTKVDGIPGSYGLVDITTLGATGHNYMSDALEKGDVSIDMVWDDGANMDVLFATMRAQAETRSFEYSPDGTVKYTGECWLEKYTINSQVGGIVMASVALKVDGNSLRP